MEKVAPPSGSGACLAVHTSASHQASIIQGSEGSEGKLPYSSSFEQKARISQEASDQSQGAENLLEARGGFGGRKTWPPTARWSYGGQFILCWGRPMPCRRFSSTPDLQYFGHLMQRADSLEKTLILGKIEGRRRRGRQRMKIVGWHHRFNGYEFEQTSGDNEGQGSLECCNPWGCKELDMTE